MSGHFSRLSLATSFCAFLISPVLAQTTTNPLSANQTVTPDNSVTVEPTHYQVAQATPQLPPLNTFVDPSLEQITVTARRLDAARINIEPQIGASTYEITHADIEAIPGGDNASLSQVILQAPGVAQDSLDNGSLHVRNEHLNVQYRINDVTLPDGVSFFGQSLSPRFVGSLKLVTGALPAEYGLRTAGIIDIQSQSGLTKPAGDVGLYGGSFGTINPSFNYSGSSNGYRYFASIDYLQSDRGIEAPTSGYNAIHDHNIQDHGFFYLDKTIDDSSRLSAMIGTFNSQFQIPNIPGQSTLGGISAINGAPATFFDSSNLHEHQIEGSQFGVLSYLNAGDKIDFQGSLFTKFSDLHYHSDQFGDLAFNGISQDAGRTSFANGFQGEGTYRLANDHTVRFGTLITVEHITADTTSLVLGQSGVDASGNPLYATTPTALIANSEKTGYTYSLYLQDEWNALPDVTVNYGGRFDVVNGYTEGNQLSPRLNAVWQAAPETTIHAGAASYFTPPPLELVANQSLAQYANTTAAPTVSTNSKIKNERAEYLDIGASQQLFDGFTVGLDLYYKYARNLLDEGQFGAPVVLTPFNYHVGYNRGVELSTTYHDGDFNYYGNLAIAEQKAEGINSAEFSFSPDKLAYADSHLINTDHSQLATASAGISYLWDDTRYSADILAGTGVRTTNPGDSVNGGTVPSYEQVNLGVSHTFESLLGGVTTFRLAVINLLDERYQLRSSTGIGVFASQYSTPRSVYAGITRAF